MTSQKPLLKFAPFKSQVDPSFWQRLTELKLDKDKLTENVHEIWGYYSNRTPEGQNQLFSVDASSFNKLPDENRLFGVGTIINKNTIEAFKDEDKIELMKKEGHAMMNIIKGDGLKKPCLLTRFHIFTFANLKGYQYYYWFAFPAPSFLSCSPLSHSQNIEDVFDREQIQDLSKSYSSLLDVYNRGFFMVCIKERKLKCVSIQEGINEIGEGNDDWMLAFSDTSSSREFPSWPLRNLMALVCYHRPDLVQDPIRILCLRENFHEGQWRLGNSIIFTVEVQLKDNAWCDDAWVGWEKNEKGKMGPRLANMKHSMDPLHLAEMSVDLNLKLMKWQIVPDLNLDVVKRARCLLVGAGTLGCVVARNLMSWGVRQITFVDYGNVSHSNPVRQFLYRFADVGRSKAETAASAIKDIFPGMVSSGFSMTVPMPGHPVGESMIEETQRNVTKLEELIDEHDVVFLLMDSRESRWLPTVIAASKGKLVINAALGFDSYLVMRHGLKNLESKGDAENCTSDGLSGDKLGCYFCNDVTAPGNSLKGRTLDQQCTVTRPGVSNMAGALAVELFVSVLQHPLGGFAPAEVCRETSSTKSCLGMVPHSVRGFLSQYQTLLPAVEGFSSCVACSPKVVGKYREEGFKFVLKVLESKEYLEELCGLTTLQNEPLIEEVLEYSDSESEESSLP